MSSFHDLAEWKIEGESELVKVTLEARRSYHVALAKNMGMKDEAEDCVQEAHGIILEKYDQAKNPIPWMKIIVQNICRNYLRRKANIALFTALNISPDIFKNQSDSEQEVLRRELIREVQKALKHLTDSEQSVITLYYYENMNQEEIGKLFGITRESVSRKHIKILAKLKNSLGYLYPEKKKGDGSDK